MSHEFADQHYIIAIIIMYESTIFAQGYVYHLPLNTDVNEGMIGDA